MIRSVWFDPACDGEQRTELRCRDAAERLLLLPRRHAGVRPLEQLQREVGPRVQLPAVTSGSRWKLMTSRLIVDHVDEGLN